MRSSSDQPMSSSSAFKRRGPKLLPGCTCSTTRRRVAAPLPVVLMNPTVAAARRSAIHPSLCSALASSLRVSPFSDSRWLGSRPRQLQGLQYGGRRDGHAFARSCDFAVGSHRDGVAVSHHALEVRECGCARRLDGLVFGIACGVQSLQCRTVRVIPVTVRFDDNRNPQPQSSTHGHSLALGFSAPSSGRSLGSRRFRSTAPPTVGEFSIHRTTVAGRPEGRESESAAPPSSPVAGNLRVRVPRGQLRHAEHPGRCASGRAEPGERAGLMGRGA